MRRILTLCACVTLFSVLALAENWSGRLVDASCYDQHKNATACDPSSSTAMFAIMVSGKAMKFDTDGNSKAAEALKSRADRSTNPATPGSTQVTAKVSGTKAEDDTIKVEAIEVQ